MYYYLLHLNALSDTTICGPKYILICPIAERVDEH